MWLGSFFLFDSLQHFLQEFVEELRSEKFNVAQRFEPRTVA